MLRPKQFKKLVLETAGKPASAPVVPEIAQMPEEYWKAVLDDPCARSAPSGVPIQNRRLSEIPRHVLRVSCRRCDRIVEIQMPDALRMYGKHAVWKEVGTKLLDGTCQERTGSREDDGCWPAFDMP